MPYGYRVLTELKDVSFTIFLQVTNNCGSAFLSAIDIISAVLLFKFKFKFKQEVSNVETRKR